MGRIDPHKMLTTYSVDEALETLPLGPSGNIVDRELTNLAPHAYSEKVDIMSVYWGLTNEAQKHLNAAVEKEYEDWDDEDW